MIYKNLIDSGKLNEGDISISYTEGQNPVYSYEKPEGFEITPADKVLSYRIKEMGILYSSDPKSPVDWDKKTVKRNSRVIMNLRVENPYSNTILYSNTLEGINIDTVPAALARKLENLHYCPSPAGYPLSYPINQDSNVSLMTTTTQSSNKGLFIVLGVLGGLALIGIAASL
jgi:hypothetical protein